MHKTQKEWCDKIRFKFSQYFINKRVLEIGSLDVNGNNRYLFTNCDYIGLDIIKGKNVDVVSIAHEYKPSKLFDVVFSTNSLEHDMYYQLTLKRMTELLKSEGLMFFSACYKFREHGTLKYKPEDSGTSKLKSHWANYYKNIEPSDIKNALILDRIFDRYNIKIFNKDLRFWGIKK